MDPITIGAALVEFAPTIAGWFVGEEAEEKVGKAVDLAKKVTGQDDPDSAVEALKQDPALAVKFEKAVMAHEVAMEKEKSRRIEAVNATMQAEAKSEHWMQWSWRPFNGFLFGLTLFAVYVVLPLFDVKGSVPEVVLMAWASVLGVTAWHRGMHKREREGGGRKASGGVAGLRQLAERALK